MPAAIASSCSGHSQRALIRRSWILQQASATARTIPRSIPEKLFLERVTRTETHHHALSAGVPFIHERQGLLAYMHPSPSPYSTLANRRRLGQGDRRGARTGGHQRGGGAETRCDTTSQFIFSRWFCFSDVPPQLQPGARCNTVAASTSKCPLWSAR